LPTYKLKLKVSHRNNCSADRERKLRVWAVLVDNRARENRPGTPFKDIDNNGGSKTFEKTLRRRLQGQKWRIKKIRKRNRGRWDKKVCDYPNTCPRGACETEYTEPFEYDLTVGEMAGSTIERTKIITCKCPPPPDKRKAFVAGRRAVKRKAIIVKGIKPKPTRTSVFRKRTTAAKKAARTRKRKAAAKAAARKKPRARRKRRAPARKTTRRRTTRRRRRR